MVIVKYVKDYLKVLKEELFKEILKQIVLFVKKLEEIQ